MLKALAERRDRDEEGFTLIELMVVVLIIAILLAIAIPTFLGARERAQNRAAQSDIRNALTAEKVFYTDNETYTQEPTTGTGAIKSIEPSLTYVGAGGAGTDTAVGLQTGVAVSGAVADSTVCVSKKSKSGNFYSLLDVATGVYAGTYYYNTVNCGGKAGTTLAATPVVSPNKWT